MTCNRKDCKYFKRCGNTEPDEDCFEPATKRSAFSLSVPRRVKIRYLFQPREVLFSDMPNPVGEEIRLLPLHEVQRLSGGGTES